eukprot:scaffold3073_cov66-Cylindrotheca_fusiformis.AAC.24
MFQTDSVRGGGTIGFSGSGKAEKEETREKLNEFRLERRELRPFYFSFWWRLSCCQVVNYSSVEWTTNESKCQTFKVVPYLRPLMLYGTHVARRTTRLNPCPIRICMPISERTQRDERVGAAPDPKLSPISVQENSLLDVIRKACGRKTLRVNADSSNSVHKPTYDLDNTSSTNMVDRGLFDKKVPFLDAHLQSIISCVAGHSRLLPSNFQPGNWDVICHSGKDAHDHSKYKSLFPCRYPTITLNYSRKVGNRRFRICIENNLRSYSNSKCRSKKSAIINEIVTSIRENSSHGGGFVRLDSYTQQWYEVGDKVARDKVGQTLRDYSSAKANRKKKREDHFAQALASMQAAIDPIQASSKDYSSRLQTLQERTRTERVVGSVLPNFKRVASRTEHCVYDSPRMAAMKLTESTKVTDPHHFLPRTSEDDCFEGVWSVRPNNQKKAWKASTQLQKSVLDFGLEQNDIEWFEADMLASP